MAKQPIELIQTPHYQQIKQNFLQEIILASEGKPSSISFIKHHLPEKPLLTQGIVQGIVIGGTNYILSTEEIATDGTRKILSHETGILPIFDTKQTFIDFLSAHLDARADAIGINFGFKLEPTIGTHGELDGKILAKGTKDHTFTGITESVGTLVKSVFANKYQKEIVVAVANDAICLLLSGSGGENGSLIAGTGYNMGLRLKDNNRLSIVNLEAGGFDKFSISTALKQIDATTKNPGKKLFEKTISGKYLAHYFNEKAKELHLSITHIQTSQELSELSHTNHSDIAGDLARAIIERSAFLVASAIAGTYEFCDKPNSFIIIGEGSLLWDGWHYHENIMKQLKALEVPAHAITIKHIKSSSINGAIGLILS
jgi:hexokinase